MTCARSTEGHTTAPSELQRPDLGSQTLATTGTSEMASSSLGPIRVLALDDMSDQERQALVPDGRPTGPEHHWTVWTTPMTEDEADQAAEWIAKTFPAVHAGVADPRSFLTIGMDRGTVELMRAAVALYVSEGGEVGAMLEIFDDWLAATWPD